MRAILSTTIAVTMLGAAIPAHAAGNPAPFEPSSKWVANYADNSCRLLRTFGEGADKLFLEVRLFEPGEDGWAVISGKPLGAPIRGQTRVTYRFAPDDGDSTSLGLGATVDNGAPAVIFRMSLLPLDMRKQLEAKVKKDRDDPTLWHPFWSTEREAKITAFEVGVSGRRRVTLHVGTMRPAMDVMRDCLDNLVGAWGLDVNVQKSLARPPLPASDPQHWLDSSDYPAAMLMGGFNDKVDVRLMVDANGTATSCDVMTMDSRPEFIKATCAPLMQRAHFKPALDAAGKPVASVYVTSVIWTIQRWTG